MKRFTETTKWRNKWYRRLSPTAKLLWLYLTDNCDCVGLIDLDLELASFDIRTDIQEKHLAELSDRLQRTVDGKIFLPGFIDFQYGELSGSCPAHKPVFRTLAARHITRGLNGYQYPSDKLVGGFNNHYFPDTLLLGLSNPTGKEKDKKRDRVWLDDVTRRINAIYNRKESTHWSEKERKAFAHIHFEEDELTMVERYYAAERNKPKNICRRDLLTFLNNYTGEVDRARRWCEAHPVRSSKPLHGPPSEAPPMSDEDRAKLVARGRRFAAELKKSLGNDK